MKSEIVNQQIMMLSYIIDNIRNRKWSLSEDYISTYGKEYERQKFIESLLLGIPAGSLTAYEDKTNNLIFVDGHMRLRTMLGFASNKFVIYSKYIPEINNLTYSKLPSKYKLKFNSISTTVNVISRNVDEKLRNDIISRIKSI